MTMLDLANFWDHIVSWLGQNIQGPMTPAAAIQAAAAVVGFLIVIIQLRGATQDRLYAHYTEICKLFMQNPELRPYFYPSGASAAEAATLVQTAEYKQKLAPKVAFMCEAIFGLVEHAVLQKSYMPRDAWKHCWRPYALERLETSEELQKFFKPNRHWYSRKMCREMESLLLELDQKRVAGQASPGTTTSSSARTAAPA
jgi:hypothetical protein